MRGQSFDPRSGQGLSVTQHSCQVSMAEATSEEVLLEHHALLSSDIVALLQKPLIRVESSPDLGVVIQSLHARLEQLTHLHGRDVTDLKRLVDELSERLQENAAETEPAQEIVQAVPDPALAEFAEQMNAAGGAQNLKDSLALVMCAIDACGGTRQLQAQLSCLSAISTANGGPEAVVTSLQGLSETLNTMGGSSQLGAALNIMSDTCTASKGPKKLASTLQSTHELVDKAGGSDKTVELLDCFKVAADGVGGPEHLMLLLTCVSDTCQAAGGSESLVAALKSSSDLVDACGGAMKLQELLQGTSKLINALGGFAKLHDILHTVAVINKQFGSADNMANLIHGLCNQAPAEESKVPQADPEALKFLQQDLIKLQKRVKANEQELGGFENAMEELRAAGRMEAMENLMQTVVDALRESCNGEQGAVQDMAHVRQSLITAGMPGFDPATQAVQPTGPGYVQAQATNLAGKAHPKGGEAHTYAPSIVASREPPKEPLPTPLQQPALELRTMNKDMDRVSALSQVLSLSADATFHQQAPSTSVSMSAQSAAPPTPDVVEQPLTGSPSYAQPAISSSLSKSHSAAPIADVVSVPHELESEAALRGESSRHISEMCEVSSTGSLDDGTGENSAGTAEEHAAAQLSVTPTHHEEKPMLIREKSTGIATKVSFQDPIQDKPGHTDHTVTPPKLPDAAAADAVHQAPPPSEGKRPDLSGLFKTKATAIVKEKRLGKMAQFASQALADSVAKAEKPVLEVLRQLTVRQKESGPSQQEMVALRETAEQNEQCIYDLKVQLSQMSEGMLQLESMQTASHKALAELWKAVKALNTPPDGDEARGVKQLHGKCISCDRPLNVVRPEHKLGELPIQDNMHTLSILRGSTWESTSRPQSSRAPGRTELDTGHKHGIDTSLPQSKSPDEYLIKSTRPASCRPLDSPGRKGYDPGSLRPATSTRTQARKLQRTREKQLGELHATSQAGTTYKSERIGKW